MSVKFDFKVKATTSDLYIRLHVGLSRGKLSYSYYLYCWFLRIAPVIKITVTQDVHLHLICILCSDSSKVV